MKAEPTLNLGFGPHGQRRWTGSHGPPRPWVHPGDTPQKDSPVSKAGKVGLELPPGTGCGATPVGAAPAPPVAARCQHVHLCKHDWIARRDSVPKLSGGWSLLWNRTPAFGRARWFSLSPFCGEREMKTDLMPGCGRMAPARWAKRCWGARWAPRVAQGAGGRSFGCPRGVPGGVWPCQAPSSPSERTCGFTELCKSGQRFNFYD